MVQNLKLIRSLRLIKRVVIKRSDRRGRGKGVNSQCRDNIKVQLVEKQRRRGKMLKRERIRRR